jgi:hypothetical protein
MAAENFDAATATAENDPRWASVAFDLQQDYESQDDEDGEVSEDAEQGHIQALMMQTLQTGTGTTKKATSTADLRQALRAEGQSDHMVEDEYLMEHHHDTFDQYNEIMHKKVYMALFAAAFPLAPLLAVMDTVFVIRLEAVSCLMLAAHLGDGVVMTMSCAFAGQILHQYASATVADPGLDWVVVHVRTDWFSMATCNNPERS